MTNLRWWGWGMLDRAYSLEERATLWPMLQTWLELPDESVTREAGPVPLEEISLRSPRLDDPMLSSLRRLLGEEAVKVDKRARVEHAYGKSYGDLIRLRAGCIPHPPDVVVYPANSGQIASVLVWAVDRDVVVIPFGGGTSILGGLELTADERPAITLDMSKLNRVLSVDPVSRTARIQAGARGPAIEAHLNPQGFTLGHFPESFELSTLGGWIATRSVGQNGIGYGKIEHIVQSTRVVTPVGLIEASNVPASAVGPNLMDVLVGSEGGYGIITEATMRIFPWPETRDYRGILFRGL
ncbi:MAG TPA: FAD-binding oxidoreductase, partial [Chloroflexi bacterium]|nr:FAD-binding oxidoreductase [Chloroflexota bacterium]